MKKRYTYLAYILSAAMCITFASAHTHPGDEAMVKEPVVSDWAQEEVIRANNLGLSIWDLPEDYRLPITRRQFSRIALEYVAIQEKYDGYGRNSLYPMIGMYLGEEDETEWSAKLVFTDGDNKDSLAYYLGVITGRGDGTFDPNGLVTRQEAAVMLTRAYGVCGGSIPEGERENRFSDSKEIAYWAADSASTLSQWGVMRGLEDGSFSPDDHFTVEQCMITFLRLYEQAPVSRKNGNVVPLFTYKQCMDFLESLTRDTEKDYYGYYESMRVVGPTATFIRLDFGGTSVPSTDLYLVYRDGGIRCVDIGLCYIPDYRFLTSSVPIENCSFSTDGKTLTCTATLVQDVTLFEELIHKAGVYHITIDVETGACASTYEALPS